MKTQTTIAVLAGAAALALAAVIIKKNRSCSSDADDAMDNMKGKLSSLKRKAQKEFKEMKDDVENNPAVERVNKWVNSPS